MSHCSRTRAYWSDFVSGLAADEPHAGCRLVEDLDAQALERIPDHAVRRRAGCFLGCLPPVS